MLSIKQFICNMFDENTYLLIDSETNEAALVDPGMQDSSEIKVIDDYIKQHNIKLTQIINTHLHLDHCFGINYVKEKYNVPLKAHAADKMLGITFEEQCRRFGMSGKGTVEIDVNLADGDIIDIGESKLRVIHVPGHSPGGIALYYEERKWIIVGDTLFRGSIGRTDLPGGSLQTLLASVKNKLFTLPDETSVLSGHGLLTTIAKEKATNPYFQ